MHRSGTSLTAEACHTLGWPVVGPEDFLRHGNEYNPSGYWETIELVTINRRLLYFLGGDWHITPSLTHNWWDSDALTALKNRAETFIRRIPNARATLKDPRLSLTLPFWQSMFPPVKYIICLRHPEDVASSVSRRDQIPAEQARALWTLYTSQALIHTIRYPRLFVFYADLIGPQGPQELQRIAQFLGTQAISDETAQIVHEDYAHGHSGLTASQPSLPLWEAALAWRQNPTSHMEEAMMQEALQFTPSMAPWAVTQKNRLKFLARQIKMQFWEDWR